MDNYGTTWDGVTITPGLIVFTNEMRAGKVVDGSVREHNPGWFDVQYRDGSQVMQNAERVATHFNGANATDVHARGHDWTFPNLQRKCALCGTTTKDGGDCPEVTP